MADLTEMCAYLLATDIDMTPLDGYALTGWEQGYGDFLVQPDLDTVWVLPTQPGTALVIGSPIHPDGTPVQVAPRQMLKTQLERLAELGYRLKVGVESEFVLYTEGDSGPAPAWDANLDYSTSHPPAVRPFFRHLGDYLNNAGIGYESIKTESAPGQAEVTFPYTDDPLAACDDYSVYKLIARDLAQQYNLIPAFMAAPATGVGNGLHLHLSLWSEHDEPGFAHHHGEDLPPLLTRAVAGMLSILPNLAPLYAPTVNSYKRYTPHSFAPVRYNWGIDHRGCAVRVCGHGKGTHLEVRLAGADADAYLALTAYVAAMVHGIEEGLTVRDVYEGDAYQDREAVPVCGDLGTALDYFEHSTAAQSLLGEDVVKHYARTAHAELNWHRRHVTDLERLRGIR
ncbi:glutamine synthetase family protein [Streptomyces sp. NPDC005799]|uniref:glutamine synthetase family protein n=1 Tax=Streptomyces sp. NPDC005799 TaxID=3154678 RepID=UPI0033E18C9B